MLFDLGGYIRYFDHEINGVFEVLATSGNTFLGGEDFDQRIINWLVEEFNEKNGIDLKDDRLALQRLKEAAERAKCELSSVNETTINLPFIAADNAGPKHINSTLTRDKFEELVKDLVNSSVEPCERALTDAKLKPSDIDKVILVGGQTRPPIIARTVTAVFGKEPSSEINPDEGAKAFRGGVTGDVKDIVFLRFRCASLKRGGIFVKLIERNTTVPVKNTIRFTPSLTASVRRDTRPQANARSVGQPQPGEFELVGFLRHPWCSAG